MKDVIEILIKNNKTIATMESCTGGGLVNAITNVEGASQVLKYSAVTYANEYKIKMGVSKDIIDKYSVYSEETAIEMAKNISNYANANYGVGITGKLNRIDENNLHGINNEVFVTIYDKDSDKIYNYSFLVNKSDRYLQKQYIIEEITKKLLEILGNF